MQSHISVQTSSGDYSVHVNNSFTTEMVAAIAELKARSEARVFLLTERSLNSVHRKFEEGLCASSAVIDHRIYLDSGEKNKHLRNLESVYDELLENGVDRKSLIIALGGGVVGDFAGFVAATILRGIAFVQVPTTLLSMVDSSVGGKVAVNVNLGKNMVGAFHQPVVVFCNTEFLTTLPEKEWVCGLAEMLKHAILNFGQTGAISNADMLSYLDEHAASMRNPMAIELKTAIMDSIAFKASVVRQDEKEGSLRATLNLGHTTAHAIESYTNYSKFSHGEAVSRGLITALLIARERGFPEQLWQHTVEVMKKLQLPLDTAGIAAADIIEHMKYDKKNVGGKIKFVLPDANGRVQYGQNVTATEIENAWSEQQNLFG